MVPNGARNAKLNFFYQQSAVNARLFFDLLKGPIATADLVVAHDGFTAGAELGYDISSAKVNKYSVGVGYANLNYGLAATPLLTCLFSQLLISIKFLHWFKLVLKLLGIQLNLLMSTLNLLPNTLWITLHSLKPRLLILV